MKRDLFKFIGACTVMLTVANANSTPIFFQGSSTPTATVTMTPAEARAAWEAELQSFIIDDLTGVSGSAPLTSSVGNVYTEIGNGSRIFGTDYSTTGYSIRGERSGASLIEFDVTFPSFVNAVGFNVIDNDGGSMGLQVTDPLTDATTVFQFLSTPGSDSIEFFGAVFDPSTFISTLRLTSSDPGGLTEWYNFTTGVGQNVVNNPNNQVPAPGSLLLIALGMAVMVGHRRTCRDAQRKNGSRSARKRVVTGYGLRY